MARTRIQIPGGQVNTVMLDQAPPLSSLADILESQGIRLNMRCGGRGLCNGCKVEVQCHDSIDTFQSCQRNMESLPADISRIRIPENSWRDHSLHGVSIFEIHTEHKTASVRSTGFGVALDIGTTTLAGALWDFSENRCLAHQSRPNPQARYGDNVLSRINYAIESDNGARTLQEILVKEGIVPLLRELCQTAKIQQRHIMAATVSGNPTMLHTLVGESLSGFATYPFKPVFLERKQVNSRDVGLYNEFGIDLLPGIGAFVGADILAGALAAGMLDNEETALLIDFGTNGEILLKHGGRYFATATAAGPAFEGGRLNCGAVARKGVIASFEWTGEGWNWELCGPHDGSPLGISGAAYIDFMASGKACGLLDHFGRFDRSFPGVFKKQDGSDNDWTVAMTENIFITESDVAELLQAKAAIGGGVLTLMGLAGVSAADLDRLFVAGGFGYHLDPRNALTTGLLPVVDLDRIRMIGNASLGGASLLLNSRPGASIQSFADTCKVIELNQIPSFEDHFTDCLLLEAMDAQVL